MLRTLTIALASLCLATGASAAGLITEGFNQFLGSGFAPSPASGQLDSDLWRVTGLSDGNGTFGGTHTTGDFARGSSPGGVTTSGVYGFNGDFLFLQWTGDDVSGSGSRDEFGLDNVVVCVETTIAVEETTWSGIKGLFREAR